MAGKKEAKQKAGPRGQIEKNREEKFHRNKERLEGGRAERSPEEAATGETRAKTRGGRPGPEEDRRKGHPRRLGNYQRNI
jgi:hypothetical protein